MFYLEIAIKVESLLIHLQFVRTRNGARPTDTLTHRCTLHPDMWMDAYKSVWKILGQSITYKLYEITT